MVGQSRLSRREAMVGTWAGRGCAVAAAGLAVAMIAGGGAANEAPVVEPVVASEPQPDQPEPESNPGLEDIGLIVTNLEGWDGPDPEPNGDSGLEAGLTTMSEDPGLVYLGVIRLGDRVRALMSAQGRQRFVKAGDRVGSATIVSITEDYVIVDEGGRKRRVHLQAPSTERLGYLGSTGAPIRIEDGRGTSVLNGVNDGGAARRRAIRERAARTRSQDLGDAASLKNPATAKLGGGLSGAQNPALGQSPSDASDSLITPDAATLRGIGPAASPDASEGS